MGRIIDEDDVLAIINKHYVLGQGLLNSTLNAIEEKIMQLPSPQIDASDTDGDMISRKFMHDLGATCIARRDDDGKLIALGRIDMLPSAQSEIIHCRECKYKMLDTSGDEWICSHPSNNAWRITANHYCGYAEGREECAN